MKKISLLTFVFCAIIAMACGGGSSSNSTVSTQNLIFDTGNIQPKPLLRSKWVYAYKKFNLDTRIIFEIITFDATKWTRLQINEGIVVDQRTFHFKVNNGLTYYNQLETGSAFFSYDNLGQRAWIESSEFPYSEILKVATLSSAGINTFSERKDYTLLGTELLSVGSASTSTLHTAIISSISNSNNEFQVQDSREQWLNNTYGMVKETFTESGIPVEMNLLSYEENADAGININGLTVSKINSNFNIEKSSLIPIDTPEAVIREIYTLASKYPENISKGKVSLAFAQNSHLYHRYYLNSTLLPTDLNNINSVEEYVAHINKNDPFTFYFSPEALSSFLNSITGETSIIGLQMTHSDGSVLSNDTTLGSGELKISKVLPLSRGWQDGVQDGDLLMTINGNTIANMQFSEIKAKLPSTESQKVDLSFNRSGNIINIQTASENHISKILNGNIAYVSIRKFTETTGSEVQKDIESLIVNNTTPSGMILDLRYNSGGSARGTRILLDYMLDFDTPINSNIIYSVKNSDEKYYFGAYSNDSMFELAKGKLVVLINDSSASASEITAGVLKQYSNALLLGDKSFGKGVSQTIRQLIDGSGVAITFQELIVAGNVEYHGNGFNPDISFTTEPGSISNDLQLNAALEYITTGNVTGFSKPHNKPAQKSEQPIQDIEFKDFHLTL